MAGDLAHSLRAFALTFHLPIKRIGETERDDRRRGTSQKIEGMFIFQLFFVDTESKITFFSIRCPPKLLKNEHPPHFFNNASPEPVIF